MTDTANNPHERLPPQDPHRRTFITRLTGITVGGTLIAGYGGFAAIAGRFLYPAHQQDTVWLFVRELASFKLGQAITYKTPSGAPVTIARKTDTANVSDFVALSSICPHLGCQVHWEPHNNRFFCPCHNGVFDPDGNPISGPPADANLPLSSYPLKIENNLLFINVPWQSLPPALPTQT